jgi:hypothetical protein
VAYAARRTLPAPLDAVERARSGRRGIYSHYSVRRPLQAADTDRCTSSIHRRAFQWLGLVDYWRRRDGPGLVPADARRSLALRPAEPLRGSHRWASPIADLAARGLASTYRLSFPDGSGRGWSLTPRTEASPRRGHGLITVDRSVGP